MIGQIILQDNMGVEKRIIIQPKIDIESITPQNFMEIANQQVIIDYADLTETEKAAYDALLQLLSNKI